VSEQTPCLYCGGIDGIHSATCSGAAPPLVPARPDSLDVAMAKVEELREARRDNLARRDRAEWDCFFHFACENSLFKRQAE
jgi:hypothetical protein